jgi:D-3-phosphoglycerate dehydrogenase
MEPLVTQAVQAVLAPSNCNVNAVNAQQVARDMGIRVTSASSEVENEYHNRMTLEVKTESKTRSVSGTMFKKVGRIVDIKGVKLESEFGPNMVYLTNEDQPGVIGAIGMFAAKHRINIANMHLGRKNNGGKAIALLEVDAPLEAEQLAGLRSLEHIQDAQSLRFGV